MIQVSVVSVMCRDFFEAGKENGVMNGDKCICEVEEDKDDGVATVCRENEVICYFKEGCLSAVLRAETIYGTYEFGRCGVDAYVSFNKQVI